MINFYWLGNKNNLLNRLTSSEDLTVAQVTEARKTREKHQQVLEIDPRLDQFSVTRVAGQGKTGAGLRKSEVVESYDK